MSAPLRAGRSPIPPLRTRHRASPAATVRRLLHEPASVPPPPFSRHCGPSCEATARRARTPRAAQASSVASDQSSGRTQSPLRPPDFATIFASVMRAERSTPFTMSTIARAATVTDVSASISTPVRSAVRTVARIDT